MSITFQNTDVISVRRPIMINGMKVYEEISLSMQDFVSALTSSNKTSLLTKDDSVTGAYSLSSGDYILTITGATTLSFQNVPKTGSRQEVHVELNITGKFNVVFPSGVGYASGVAPVAPSAAGKMYLTFVTYDDGATWAGFQLP